MRIAHILILIEVKYLPALMICGQCPPYISRRNRFDSRQGITSLQVQIELGLYFINCEATIRHDSASGNYPHFDFDRIQASFSINDLWPLPTLLSSCCSSQAKYSSRVNLGELSFTATINKYINNFTGRDL